jgi:hypothetical protein
MSENVRSYGFMAVLEVPVDHADFHDKAWYDKSPLCVNYEGTLVYIDFNRMKSHHERENIYGLFIGDERLDASLFVSECRKYGLSVDQSSRRQYNCIWYNGSDSDMSLLTKKEFLSK